MGLKRKPATAGDAFVEALREFKSTANPYELAAAMTDQDRAELADVVIDIAASKDGFAPELEPLLAYMAVERWPEVIEVALRHVARDGLTRARTDIVDEAGHQVPELLNPWIQQVFETPAPKELAGYAFRSGQISAFLDRVAERGVGATPSAQSTSEPLEPWPEPARHLVFPMGHTAATRVHSRHDTWPAPHPTWAGEGPEARFGGLGDGTCGLCRGRLHRLIDIGRFPLEVCLSCLGREQPHGDWTLTYAHESGVATPLDRVDTAIVPSRRSQPYCSVTVRLADHGPRFRYQWSRGNLNKLGGSPAWQQEAEGRPCRRCNGSMPMALQLDSGLPTEDNREWGFSFGSSGVMYGFVCEPCQVSTFLYQCT